MQNGPFLSVVLSYTTVKALSTYYWIKLIGALFNTAFLLFYLYC